MDIPSKRIISASLGLSLLAGLYLTSLSSYLLFHSLAEMFSIAVAAGIFIVAWNTRGIIRNNYLLLLGIFFLFHGFLDLLHTLSYKGMGVFEGYGANLPTQLWIASRYLESISLLVAPLFIGRKLKAEAVFSVYLAVTALLLGSIFLWKVFPDCFVEGTGLTPFKKASEYVTSLIFLGAFGMLYLKRDEFSRGIFTLISASLFLNVGAGLAFTFYISVYGISNLVGHFFELLSIYLIYKALIETGLRSPYELLFREIKNNEHDLAESLEETRTRKAETSALLDASRLVLKHPDLESSAREIFGICKEITGATGGYVALLSQNCMENEVLFLDPGGRPCTVDHTLPMPIRGLREVAYREGKAVYENDFLGSKWTQYLPKGHVALNNVLFAPLMVEGRALGIIGLSNKPRGFTDDDARMASAFAELVSIALNNSKTKEKLMRSEERFRAVSESARDAIVTMDSAGSIAYWNKGAEEIFGFAVQEAIGQPMTVIMPERYRADHSNAYKRTVANGEMSVKERIIEFEGKRKDGSEFPLELSLASWNMGGERYFTGIARDITERKRTQADLERHRAKLEEMVRERTVELEKANADLEEEIAEHLLTVSSLRQSEERYRKILETANEAILVADVESGVIVDANEKASELTGRQEEELIGIHQSKLHPFGDEEVYRQAFNRAVRLGTAVIGELIIERSDGERVPVEVSTSVTELGGRKVMQGIFRDLRERKRMEEEILKSQKLESIAVLAGGIAHDFNNILTAILNNITLARMSCHETEKMLKRLDAASEAVDNAQSLTYQLLTFSKGGAPVIKTAYIGQMIKETSDFVLRGSNVACLYDIAEDLKAADVDEGQISQAISNLVINACQAMPDGGRIHISAENVQRSTDGTEPEEQREFLVIEVRDEGCGIPREHITKIFDPYFTTKEGGNGLGLSSAYSIVKNHGGRFDVESSEKGTVFRIYLPASAEKSLGNGEVQEHESPLPASGRVLIMDDKEDIRESLEAALSLFGFDVHFATEGAGAVELYEAAMKEGRPFEAVVLDLTVPGGMGGKETAEMLRKLDPSVRTIVSSGYSEDPVMSEYGKYGFDAVVCKPYRIDELVKVLSSIIAAVKRTKR